MAKYVANSWGDLTSVLTRRSSPSPARHSTQRSSHSSHLPNPNASRPTSTSSPRNRTWPARRRTVSDEAVAHLPKLSKSITQDEEVRAKSSHAASIKLGTFTGVFVPTSLNVLSILMFLRFGFILGQSGILGMMGMLVTSYLINLITTLSISAISTNGTVRGGGAYYLISRSLGPEFGGSIGVVFYLGYVFNTGMNAVGLVDCIINNYGEVRGSAAQIFPESFWWNYLYASVILVFCTIICLLGSGIFAKASSSLLVVLLVATFSIPISTLFVSPINDPSTGVYYTGLSMQTFKENLMPRFTKNAAGSARNGKSTFQDLFGILFPATGGIFAGASMSGDLQNPSKSIPAGTLQGLLLTFISYTLVILSMGASIGRESMYINLNVIQDINVSALLILAGEFATSFFSALMGVIGSAKLLQALARDNILPGVSFFSQGTSKTDEPIYAILFTYLIAQLTLLADINQIASFVTMTYLMTFLVTNLACFLLKISSAPNFRPSFHYFRWWTAAMGAVVSAVTMFVVDGGYASACLVGVVGLFAVIHYTTPPKSWGDVSQSLIYHQVRKYLLRLRQEHVKFWRPQILLMVNDPRRSYNLIQFCNALKKGALYILGHVIVTPDFQGSFPEAKKQQQAWMKYIDFSKVKAFVQIAISPGIEWGMRNIVLSAGLGGMRPNIAVLGMYNLEEYRKNKPLIDVSVPEETTAEPANGKSKSAAGEELPTDECRIETSVPVTSWVNMLEDLLLSLQINVGLARGFSQLELPHRNKPTSKKYIDLWPIQMSAQITSDSSPSGSVLTTNFDTYTLILQLGCILHTVPAWKSAFVLRVVVFVEYESDVEEERGRVVKLLENLRIQATVVVTWLAKGDLKSYEWIVNGVEMPGVDARVEQMLGKEEWWTELQRRRREAELDEATDRQLGKSVAELVGSEAWPISSFLQQGNITADSIGTGGKGKKERFRKFLRRRHSVSGLKKMGMSLGNMNMQTHRLNPSVVSHVNDLNSSDSSSSSDSEVGMDDDASSINSVASEGDIDTRPTEFDFFDRPRRRATDMDGIDWAARSRRRASTGGADDVYQKALAKSERKVGNKWANQDSGGSSPSTSRGGSKASSIKSSSIKSSKAPLKTPVSQLRRPALMSRNSNPTFTSTTIPQTHIPETDGTGPTIMFADQEPPSSTRLPPSHHSASGFPSQAAVPLSFNDLPSLAQHLILNELIRNFSDDTAVVFTTLPSPVAGTWKTEQASVEYIEGLDCLCEGLPPVMLVHSNSMVVTMAL